MRRHHTARPLAAEARRVCRTGAAVAEEVRASNNHFLSLLSPDTEAKSQSHRGATCEPWPAG